MFDNPAQQTKNPLHQAVSLLARREHSVQELTRKLLSKGHAASDVEAVITDLQTRGYLDEKRYAQALLRYQSGRGQGPLKIRHLLHQQELAASLINEVFAEFEGDWFVLVAQVREKRFGPQKLPVDTHCRFKEKNRQIRFLMSRGFEQEQIHYALSSIS